jgi:Leucine-rich repeat (LRR) protein
MNIEHSCACDCDYKDSLSTVEISSIVGALAGSPLIHFRLRQQALERFPSIYRYYPKRVQTSPIDLSLLSMCQNLTTLDLHGISSRLRGLESLVTLQHLFISWDVKNTSKSVKNLLFLSNFTELQTLTLLRCQQLKSLSGIEYCTSLVKVHLQAPRLSVITELGRCPTLENIILAGCRVKDLSPLATCYELRTVQLACLKRVVYLGDLRDLPNLHSFVLYECMQAMEAEGWSIPEFRGMDFKSSGWSPSEQGWFTELQCADCVHAQRTGVNLHDYDM